VRALLQAYDLLLTLSCRISFGKPWAHVYVDDLAVNALLDTRKEIGWHSMDELSLEESEQESKGMLAPRSFK
jgi:hypothetical protein